MVSRDTAGRDCVRLTSRLRPLVAATGGALVAAAAVLVAASLALVTDGNYLLGSLTAAFCPVLGMVLWMLVRHAGPGAVVVQIDSNGVTRTAGDRTRSCRWDQVRTVRVVDSRSCDEDLPTPMPGVSIMFEDRDVERELFVNDWFSLGRSEIADIVRRGLEASRQVAASCEPPHPAEAYATRDPA